MSEPLIDAIQFNQDGLVPAIAQDADSGEILMMAWMNAESIRLSMAENRAIYYSRSRQALWRKGEQSGHIQELKALLLDCDGDTILLKVKQIGDIACHTGRRSCFYQQFDGQSWQTISDVLKDPNTIY
ncbi:MAG: phosphoribosyl-AMP cyclohydrolase [Pseudomonadales bacterium]|nr:phosphoribosyl-AMP cyclohydrolase [Pseudomonadales bacterium]